MFNEKVFCPEDLKLEENRAYLKDYIGKIVKVSDDKRIWWFGMLVRYDFCSEAPYMIAYPKREHIQPVGETFRNHKYVKTENAFDSWDDYRK